MKKFLMGVSVSFVAFVLSSAVYASDSAALKLYGEAETAYKGRADLQNIEKALSLLDQALKEVVGTDLRYDILILKSRALNYKGTQQKTDEARMQLHEAGYNVANEAKQVDDSYAEAYFYYGINLGRWAEAKGVLASLGRKKELIGSAESAAERVTREGDSGETIDSFGPARVLGRIYFKLPSWAGGDNEKSLEYLKTAYENGSENALGVVYYAETLAAGTAEQKALAKSILDKLLANDPKTYNPARVPETIEEFELARALRKKLD